MRESSLNGDGPRFGARLGLLGKANAEHAVPEVCLSGFEVQIVGQRHGSSDRSEVPLTPIAVSYTHLTLPTIITV